MGEGNYSATSNYVEVGTLAVDGWAVTFGTARRDWAGPQPAQAPHRCTKCNSLCTHQRPVYQSPYCCMTVRGTAVLMCPLKG